MTWPLSQDYNEAIQNPATNFADPDLRRGEAATNRLGLPMPYSGNFADVYQVRCPDGSRWAVKCFTREVPALRERYQEISKHLRQARLPFTVDFTYLEQGIRVAGQWYPVLKMQWVEGLTLNQFVKQFVDRPGTLEALLQAWARMAKYLRAADIGHCDLQHGNVVLVPGAGPTSLALKLIDYDGMWVPALEGKESGEVGHPSYQHPQRLKEGTYSLDVDRFPVLLVASALRALKAKGLALWDRYDNGDNILFRESDLASPARSELFQALGSLPDPGVAMLTAHVRSALKNDLAATPLLEDVMSEAPGTPPAAPAVPPAASSRSGAPDEPAEAVPDRNARDGDDDAPRTPARPSRRRKRARAGKKGVLTWAWAVAIPLFAAGLGAVVWIIATLAAGGAARPASGPAVARNSPAADPPQEAGGSTVAPHGAADVKRDPPSGPRPAVNEPEVTLMKGHVGFVTGVFFSRDGASLVSVGRGDLRPGATTPGQVIVWDVRTGQARRTLKGHTSIVNDAAFSPDELRIASAGSDGLVKLWDAATGQEVATLKAPGNDVRRVCFSPDGARIAAVSGNGGPSSSLRLWDAHSGQELFTFDCPGFARAVSFRPDGSRVALASGGLVQAGGGVLPGEFRVWDARSGHPLLTIPAHASGFSSVCFSPDGARLLTAAEAHFEQGNLLPSEVRVRDADTGTELLSLGWSKGHAGKASFSRDGKAVFNDGGDGMATVWDAATGQPLLTVSDGGGMLHACLTPDGQRAATSYPEGLKIWDVRPFSSGAPAPPPVVWRHDTGGVMCMCFSPDGRSIATGGIDSMVRIWRTVGPAEGPRVRGGGG